MKKKEIFESVEKKFEDSYETFAYIDREIHEKSLGYIIIKRSFDVVAATIAFLLLLPFLLLICILIRLDSKGPVIFVHMRYGKHGKPLPLLKFRTMYMNAEAMIKQFTLEQREEWNKNFKLDNDPRVTRIGKFLRKTSIDELPQLLNIIRGDLSIVGSRPIIADELERYNELKEKLLSMRPGLTGYWQAYARSDCSYNQRMAMEMYYIDNASFWWDVKIIFATVVAVLRQRGAK